MGHVYGDWTFSHTFAGQKVHTPRAFLEHGYEAKQVAVKPSGQDRTDTTMALEAYEVLLQGSNITAFMIVSGDGDFAYLARKIRSQGKRLIVCALTNSASPEIITISNPFVSIESLLNITVTTSTLISPKPKYNWEEFINLLAKAEKTLPFVALKLFRDQWLSFENPKLRGRIVNEAIDEGIAKTFNQPNPKNPSFPTTAIKLNRSHQLVKEILEKKT